MAKIKYEPGDKARKVEHNLRVARLPIIDLRNPQKIYKRTEEYFELCQEDDVNPTVAGYALSLGIDRMTLYRWLKGDTTKPPEVMRAVEWGMSILNAQMEESIMDGKGNVVGQIFLTKNNFADYTDTREVIVQKQAPELTAEQLIKAASKLPGFNQKQIDSHD